MGTSLVKKCVLNTTLKGAHVAIERNMFPYSTPKGVAHCTLWSRTELTHDEVVSWVEEYLDKEEPHVKAWNFDLGNLVEGLSIDLWHVHVYLQEE